MTHATHVLKHGDFPLLLDALSRRGYVVIGPTVRDAAIVYDEIRSVENLPAGWTDEQEAGTYRLKKREDDALFGYVVGPQSWKRILFPPRERLWAADKSREGFRVTPEPPDERRYAFLGARSCEIHAVEVQDRVFLKADPQYAARRKQLFIVAVQCGQAGGTCFCVSMKTGPRATWGFDLALTEFPGSHFVLQIGSERGAEVASELPLQLATPENVRTSEEVSERAARSMGRTMDTTGIQELLCRTPEHPRWVGVASRCLACANCTLVCPTCFCQTVEDVNDLTGDHTERWRRWDSCFTLDHSYLHGGSVRQTGRSRYRQWMTHKLATWIDQFGVSGCVGCGRCITWCPAAIDITEEARAIRESGKEPANEKHG